MRILLFKKKSDPFFFSYEMPSSKELGRIDTEFPHLNSALLEETDVMRRIATDQLLKECYKFLNAHPDELKINTPKSLEVVCPKQGTVRGPASGLSSILVDKVRCLARIDDDRVLLEWFEGAEKISRAIHGDRLVVDGGELVIRFRRGTGLANLFLQLKNSMEEIRQKNIWLMVEA